MNRRPLRSFMVAVIGASWLVASLAHAAPKDAAVIKIDRDAIYNDYLATKFPNAEKKLRKAIGMCASGGCSPRVFAGLHRDLGIVYVVSGRTPAAQQEFATALGIDPTITLVKELNTPEIQAAFNAAKAGGGEAPAEAAPEAPAAPPARAAGGEDIIHTPPAEQLILTPVPLFAEMPEGVTPAKVQARYKVFGATEWKTIELRKSKGGYGGEVPCLDIGSETGDLKYYIQAIDANGDVVATSGSKSNPHKIPIKNELAGEPPHLPGKPPPAQCANAGDCPPGLPGCASAKKKKHGDKEWGSTCELDSECQSGACKDGTCAAEGEAGGPAEATKCEKDGDCASGQVCSGGVCGSKSKKNFLSVSVQQDMLLLSSATEVCASQNDYTCFFNDNSQYGGQPNVGDRDQVSGGFGLATTRILVGFDRLFGENITLGVKLGYAFNGGPAAANGGKAFLPVHAEGRVAYYFGKNPFGSTGIRPYITVNGGVAEIDARVTVQVTDQSSFGGSANPSGQGNLAAWKKGGTSFVGGGLGAMWLTSPGSGFLAELRLLQLFSSSATAVSLQIGYAIGL